MTDSHFKFIDRDYDRLEWIRPDSRGKSSRRNQMHRRIGLHSAVSDLKRCDRFIYLYRIPDTPASDQSVATSAIDTAYLYNVAYTLAALCSLPRRGLQGKLKQAFVFEIYQAIERCDAKQYADPIAGALFPSDLSMSVAALAACRWFSP